MGEGASRLFLSYSNHMRLMGKHQGQRELGEEVGEGASRLFLSYSNHMRLMGKHQGQRELGEEVGEGASRLFLSYSNHMRLMGKPHCHFNDECMRECVFTGERFKLIECMRGSVFKGERFKLISLPPKTAPIKPATKNTVESVPASALLRSKRTQSDQAERAWGAQHAGRAGGVESQCDNGLAGDNIFGTFSPHLKHMKK